LGVRGRASFISVSIAAQSLRRRASNLSTLSRSHEPSPFLPAFDGSGPCGSTTDSQEPSRWARKRASWAMGSSLLCVETPSWSECFPNYSTPATKCRFSRGAFMFVSSVRVSDYARQSALDARFVQIFRNNLSSANLFKIVGAKICALSALRNLALSRSHNCG